MKYSSNIACRNRLRRKATNANSQLLLFAASWTWFLLTISATHGQSPQKQPLPQQCRIHVVDEQSGWPVPLVELRTVHNVRFVTDNAGNIAFDLPELMGRETWFDVIADGYEVPADGFGRRGVRLSPVPGKKFTVKVERTCIAKCLGRITGAGLFAESQKLGRELNAPEYGVMGCDSIQNAVHDGKLFWAWGDTGLPHYVLGIFHMTGATTPREPLKTFEPPLRLKLDYFRDDAGNVRAIAKMPGSGPTWASGFVSLPDQTGTHHLVASYVKINPPLEAYRCGLCVWNDELVKFEHLKTLWTKSDASPKRPPFPEGHPVIADETDGNKWVLFCNPFPKLRCPARYEAWQDANTWESLQPQQEILTTAGDKIKPHAGAIAWNDYRGRWVAIFTQIYGQPSFLGEIWYAEADAPEGPWGPAVKVLSHAHYTFYNPQLHPEFTPPDSPILLFEGTYTKTFAGAPEPAPTPRYDYNQIMYRLDLDDPQLAGAHKPLETARD